jgi:nucleotide-binding universal stress UspA family protein
MQSPITHIAAGADGSDEGKDAAALAAGLAAATGAGLTLVRVFPTTLFPSAGITDRATLQAQADQRLRRDRDELAPDALLHSVADLSVSRALSHFAQRTHAGLIVIGSSPTALCGRTAIGRRGRQLLHDMPFALALACRGLHERPVALRRIAVGIDGGPEAQVAKATAIELCRAADATLVLATVIDNRYPLLVGAAPAALPEYERAWKGDRESTQTELEQAASELDVPAEAHAVIGDPGLELRTLSDHVDLVVVGSRRWGPIARLVTGGVGETLVADAGCSVLIVPRPDDQPS